jgi:hypothetical protein
VSLPFPEPGIPVSSRAEVFLGYLDFFRSRLVSKLEALPEAELRRSRLPSGWTPLELLKHVAYDELRWLEWRFEGRDVGDPWADDRDGGWYVSADETLPELVAALRAQAARSRPPGPAQRSCAPGEARRPVNLMVSPGRRTLRCPGDFSRVPALSAHSV